MRNMIGVGLIGMGVVGSGVAKTITEKSEALNSHVGLPLKLTGVAVRDILKQRSFNVSSGILGNDPAKIVNDDSVNIVVELMGGSYGNIHPFGPAKKKISIQ